MPQKRCCVRNCNSTRADSTTLHLFPNPETELDRFNKWTTAIGGDLLYLDAKTIYRDYRVCHFHFDPKYHTRSKRLSAIAVPSLKLQGYFPQQRLQDITNRVYSHTSAQESALEQLTGSVVEQPEVAITPDPLPSTSVAPVTSVSNQRDTSVSKRKPFLSKDMAALKMKIKKLQNSKDSAKKSLKKAMVLSQNETFQKALKAFTATAIIFTMLQFREFGKHKMGRRFTKKEKIMSMALYKQGPRSYRWLRKIFVLPSPLTLSRMITKASLKPGINGNIFSQLKKRVAKMSSHEKLCALIFDEIALTPHLDYCKRKDEICGFVDNGDTKKSIIADHALVFMIRGIQKNYKQPISYSFCAATTPKLELVKQIKCLIKELHSIGFKVLVTICDQGATNVAAINWLIEESRQEYVKKGKEFKNKTFEVDGEEVVPLYDTPHLMKGIRNNLITKDLKAVIDSKVKIAKWDHIIKLYNEDPAYQGLRLMPKLTDQHVIPKKISKMKVKCATQIFSRSVATTMGYLASIGIIPEESKDTADIILFFDNLFDSLNGSYVNVKNRSGKYLLGPVTPQSAHKKHWMQAKKVLATMKFISKDGKEASVPSLKNWLQTINNIEYFVQILHKKYNVTSIWMRHLNQDPLENFFGSIRSHGYRNNSPTCVGFEAAFASLLINNMSSTNSPGTNCEADNCSMFASLSKLFFGKTVNDNGPMCINYEDINSNMIENFEEKMENVKVRAQLQYVTGYILKKLKISKCPNCQEIMYSKNKEGFVKFKEYFKDMKYLNYASYQVINCFSNIQDITTKILEREPEKKGIKNYIKTIIVIIINYNFITCSEHKSQVSKCIEEKSINLFLYNWCKDTNKILNGNRSDFNDNSNVQRKAYEYYCKNKSKKNK